MPVKVNQNIAISENGFLFNPSTGESFTTNPIGARFISYLQQGMADNEIINLMYDEYAVERKELERDLLDFKGILKHHNLIEENEKTNA